jgi:hypothetical protein
MKTLYGFTTGVLLTLIASTYLAPKQTLIEHEIQVTNADRIHIEQIITTLDLNDIRDTSAIDPNLELQLLAECAYAIQAQTDEPLAGIIFYVDRYWTGDTCAAYEHLVRHGWY